MSDNGHSSASHFSADSKKLLGVIIALAIIVVVAIGLIIFLLTKSDASHSSEPEDVSGGRGTVITENNVEEVKGSQQDAETVQDGYYVTSMSIDWHFDGLVSEDAYVANATENKHTVYFDLFLVDTGEMIYSSPYIPVGAEMKGVTLDKELDSGTYETILVYHLVDENEAELSTLSISLNIYVN